MAPRRPYPPQVHTDDDPPQLLLTIEQVAHTLKVGRTRVYSWLDQPDGLPTVRLGRSVRVHVKDVESFAERLRVGHRPYVGQGADTPGAA